MGFSIAVAGKGGSGKTSIASLIIRYLIKNNLQPVLAVDADPNANLGESLGFEVPETVGHMLDAFQKEKINIPSGMTKQAYLQFQLNSIMVESKGIDLITMGRGEGPECYCYPNLVLKEYIDSLAGNYPYTVMDNEAGMEHLSRGTTQDINELLIVSNHSIKGVRTIARIQQLISELKLRVIKQRIIINMVPGAVDPHITEEMHRLGLELSGIVPEDDNIYEYDLNAKSLLEMPDSSPAVKAVNNLMANILCQEAIK